MSDHKMYEVLDSQVAPDGTVVEVLQFTHLKGSADTRSAESLFFAEKAGMSLKTVRIRLSNSQVRLEPGVLYYMKGQLEMKTSTGGGVFEGLKRKVLAGESFFVNDVYGTGDVYLEPTFGHFLLHSVAGSEDSVIVDQSIFYAGTNGLNVTAAMQKNISTAIFGGEGIFQTKIEGIGVAILYCPVPPTELECHELCGDSLAVDGDFALMRTSGVDFSVRKSSKGLLSSVLSGEGMLQTFRGHGKVWIAPTQGVYERMITDWYGQTLSVPQKGSHTDTDSTGKERLMQWLPEQLRRLS